MYDYYIYMIVYGQFYLKLYFLQENNSRVILLIFFKIIFLVSTNIQYIMQKKGDIFYILHITRRHILYICFSMKKNLLLGIKLN